VATCLKMVCLQRCLFSFSVSDNRYLDVSGEDLLRLRSSGGFCDLLFLLCTFVIVSIIYPQAMAPKKASMASKVQVEVDAAPTTEFVLEQGDLRYYPKIELSDEVSQNRIVHTNKEKVLVVLLMLFALIIRVGSLKDPNSVVFDEVHFGGFARKYINGAFFMDVHPPLAKLLFAAVGALGGFKGDFLFTNIGDVFPPNVPYVLMRQLSAFMGVGTVLFMYFTLRASGCKPAVALLTSSLLVIENGMITISRYILLDSPLIFFIAGTAFFYTRSEICKPFSFDWFKHLSLCGIFLGFAVSSKWVGLFTFAWLGLANVLRLWFEIGDLSVPVQRIIKSAAFRGIILLGLPAIIYVFSFYIHLQVLTQEGDGAAFMSSAFRIDFEDTTVPRVTDADVGVSSIITLRHLNTHGGYLHSHDHLYEGGSGQQQVTLYPHLDENNRWIIELYNETSEPFEFKPITDGTKIRLNHMITNRRLHAHDIRPAVSSSDWQNEASCYGFEGFEGDPNDDFIVEIVKDASVAGDAQERLRAIDTIFRLRHAMTGCYLWSHDTTLPEWGFNQQEVTCATQGIKPLSYWYIEDNTNIYLPQDAEKIGYKPLSFFQKFIELHKKMWKINSGLTATHVYESRPLDWILLNRGISYWAAAPHHIYLLGNPIVWWPASFLFLAYGIYIAVIIFKFQLGSPITISDKTFTFNYYTFSFLLGWFLHYYPFFLMERQLFLHHYFPALYFGLLALGHCFQLFASIFSNRKTITYLVFGLIFTSSLYSYYQRLPLTNGGDWTVEKCEATKWLSGWDYNCANYPYENADTNAPALAANQGYDFDAAVKPAEILQNGNEQQQPLVNSIAKDEL
jgi:dolichyl-phosphate-mannose-protein mannosyltransferase